MNMGDIYYTDQSHLIDTNSGWMENSVLTENANLMWQEESGSEIAGDNAESAGAAVASEPARNDLVEQTIGSNESFLTANSGSENTSQYFSILNSNCDSDDDNNGNETSDNNGTKCLVVVDTGKEEVVVPDNVNEAVQHLGDNQMTLYRLDGTDEMIAVQIMDDGNGNYKKYGYRVRQAADGQFEAISGTIEVTRTDSEGNEIQNENIESEEFLDNELDKNEIEEGREEEEGGGEEEYISDNDNLEIEPPEYLDDDDDEEEEEEEDDYQTVEGIHVTGDNDSSSQSEQYENIPEPITNIYPDTDTSESEYEIETLDEDFQDSESLPEDQCFNEMSQILQHKLDTTNKISPTSTSSTPVPSSPVKMEQKPEPNNHVTYLSYLIVSANEKENVGVSKTNPRSILKSNVNPKLSKPLPSIISIKDSTVQKVAKDPKPVNVIVSKSERQPRKQTIKPVERVGSEIIVHPLVYSLNEQTSGRSTGPVKRKRGQDVLEINDDSDPEFTLKSMPKRKYKRKNSNSPRRETRKKTIAITIDDSDDDEESISDDSVIELHTDYEGDEEDDDDINTIIEKVTEPIKKKEELKEKDIHSTKEDTNEVEEELSSEGTDKDEEDAEINSENEENVEEVNNENMEEDKVVLEELNEESDKEENVDEENKDKTETKPLKKTINTTEDFNKEEIKEKSVKNESNKINKIVNKVEEPVKAKKIETRTMKKLRSSTEDTTDKLPIKEFNKQETIQKNNNEEETKIEKSKPSTLNKCPLCPKTFPRQLTLKKHMTIHSARRNLRSSVIAKGNETIGKKEVIKKPVTNNQPSSSSALNKSFNCNKCKLKFHLESQFKRHQTIHAIKKRASIDKLNLNRQKTPIKSTFVNKTRLRSSGKMNATADTRTTAIKAAARKESATKVQYKCEICSQTFSQRILFTLHSNKMHTKYSCPKCKSKFTTKLLFDQHVQKNCTKSSSTSTRNMSTSSLSFTCDICKKKFPVEKQLQTHLLTHETKARRSTKSESSIKTRQFVGKGKEAHGGVPIPLKMQKALAKMKLKT